jgi:guanylate kinase
LEKARLELNLASTYQYTVVNDTVVSAAEQIKKILLERSASLEEMR